MNNSGKEKGIVSFFGNFFGSRSKLLNFGFNPSIKIQTVPGVQLKYLSNCYELPEYLQQARPGLQSQEIFSPWSKHQPESNGLKPLKTLFQPDLMKANRIPYKG